MLYLKRDIEKALITASKLYHVVVVTGPRQSGKTTLVKHLFKDKPYVNLEFPDVSEIIQSDPKAFFNKYKDGVIIDEIQRIPELIRYIQGIVDEKKKKGMFILTGSNQFLLLSKITQSLAGRVAMFKLLPLSLHEMNKQITNSDTSSIILNGFYPAVISEKLPPYMTYQNYYDTYIERDVREISNLKNLSDFRKFVRLCAGRTAQILNANSLSNDIGISVHTVKAWLSILEASFIIFMLPPWYDNIRKRLIKSPKIFFYDVGMVAYLLGIENISQLSRDPLRGALFENMVIMEFIKSRFNKGLDSRYHFYRDNHGNEIDLIEPSGNNIKGVEIKSSQTFNKDFLKGLNYLKNIYLERCKNNMLIYDGENIGKINHVEVINFRDLAYGLQF
jgi:predicted AAA+ superfamily ATPase